jgi:hypothetical protein
MNTPAVGLDDFFLSSQQEIAEKVVDRQYSLYPAFWKPYGSQGRRLSIRDAGYHLPFLSESIAAGNPNIFIEYVRWVKKLFRGLNFPDQVMIATLESTQAVLETYLPADQMQIVSEYLKAGIGEMGMEPEEDHSCILADNPLYKLALEFHQSLARGDKNTASRLITTAVDNNVPIRDIYLHVFQVSQYEVGRKWLRSELSVAQEHFCSAATQMIMSQLYPYIFSGE